MFVSKMFGVLGGAVITALILITIAAASSGCAKETATQKQERKAFLIAQLGHDGNVARCWFTTDHTLWEKSASLEVGGKWFRIAGPYNYASIRDGDIANAALLIGVEDPTKCMGIPPTPVSPGSETY